jgi:hypothetical protein
MTIAVGRGNRQLSGRTNARYKAAIAAVMTTSKIEKGTQVDGLHLGRSRNICSNEQWTTDTRQKHKRFRMAVSCADLVGAQAVWYRSERDEFGWDVAPQFDVITTD